MCGLVGFYSANEFASARNVEIFKWLLYLDVVRGDDSTGVALRRYNKETNNHRLQLVKAPGIPANLYRKFPEVFSSKGDLLVRDKESISLAIGHNRAATIGGNAMVNAHPFRQGSIVGAHNGTILGGLKDLPRGPEVQGQTDSELLFYALSKGKSLKEVVNTVNGAMALTWWDSDKKTLSLFRNKERPLWTLQDNIGSTVLWASEKWMLEFAVNRTRHKNFYKEPVELPVDTLWVFQEGDKTSLEKTAELIVKTYAPPKVPDNTSLLANHSRTVVPDYLKTRDTRGWLDTTAMSQVVFEAKTKFGCALCSADLTWEDHKEGQVFFLDSDTVVCAGCAKEFSQEVV